MEVVLGDAIVTAEMALGLVPKVLNPVDVVAVLGEQFRVIDAEVVEVRDIENVIGLEAIRVDDAIRPYLALNDGYERF